MAGGRQHNSSLLANRNRGPPSERGLRERERGRERDRDRDRDRDRERERERERERTGGSVSDRDRPPAHARTSGDGYGSTKEKDKDLHLKEREKERERSRDRDGDKGGRERDRDRERDRARERDREQGTRAMRWHPESESDRRPSTPRERGGVVLGTAAQAMSSFVVSPASDTVSEREQHLSAVPASQLAGRPGSRDTEREPGELSSGSRNEDGDKSQMDFAESREHPSQGEEGSSAVAEAATLSQSMSKDQAEAATSGSAAGLGEPLNPPPAKKRKFSPIVWDLDDRSGARSKPLGASVSSTTVLRVGASQEASSQRFGILAGRVAALRDKDGDKNRDRDRDKDRGKDQVKERERDRDGDKGRSVSPLSPVAQDKQVRVSPLAINNGIEPVDVAMGEPEQIVDSPMQSNEGPEPGQLLPGDSPLRNEDEEVVPPPITIAASRWAEETHTPEPVKSPHLGLKSRAHSLDSQDEHTLDRDRDQLRHASRGLSTSPEPGEYVQDKPEDGRVGKVKGSESDGSVGLGSGGRDASGEQEEDERELNKRELMELDEEGDADDAEEQRPELESESDDEALQTVNGTVQRTIDMLQGCRSVDEFERLNKIDEGTYGVVYRARDRRTGEIVALKKVKMEKEREGFPMTSLREINVLLSFHHPSVVDVKEVVVGSNLDSIFMVMEYMEHDLKGLMESMKQPFSQSEVKCLMLQLFEGVKYLHDNWVLHRDLKTSNLLLNNRGELKICDFGLARQYGSPLKEYTHMVVTLWYRAPELLLGTKLYSTAIDMWSLGCIMAEFLAKEPLFNGKTEIDQLDKIFKILGTPTETIWPDYVKLPGVKCNFVRQPYNRLREKFPPTAFAGRPALSENGFDLLNKLLTYDPLKRITAEEALKHDWFREVPLPKAKEFMPTFPARSEQESRRIRRLMRSPDPLEEQRRRELRQAELGGGGLFG